MNLTIPRFGFHDLSLATRLPANTIRSWHARGLLVMSQHDRESSGRGVAALFSGHTALQVVIMGALTRLGVPVEKASKAGAAFAHTGESPAKYVSDACDPSREREPGGLFPSGETVLLVGPGDRYTILNVDRATPSEMLVSEVWRIAEGGAAAILLLDDLIFEARAKLGLG